MIYRRLNVNLTQYCYQRKLTEISRTAQAGFNAGDFEDLFFPLPPYNEQKRIVDAINKAFTTLDRIMGNL